jgi:large subunit ribosomal protein L18
MTSLKIKKNRSKAKLDYSKPVVVISRSNKNITAQLLLENGSKTALTVSSIKMDKMTKTEKSTKVGEMVAKKLKELKIESVLFNRNGLIYHGRVKAVAEAIRESGINI